GGGGARGGGSARWGGGEGAAGVCDRVRVARRIRRRGTVAFHGGPERQRRTAPPAVDVVEVADLVVVPVRHRRSDVTEVRGGLAREPSRKARAELYLAPRGERFVQPRIASLVVSDDRVGPLVAGPVVDVEL